MRAALGISNDLRLRETRDSFSEKTAPFVKEVSKDGTTFFEYMMNPDNAEMVTLANDGVVGWLNVSAPPSLPRPQYKTKPNKASSN